MQIDYHREDDRVIECRIPSESSEVIPGVVWGNASEPFTPAYWKFLCTTKSSIDNSINYKLGDSLEEEVVACLLGGHGIVGELGTAAFRHLSSNGLFTSELSLEQIESLLETPIHVDRSLKKYRFPKQKAKYVCGALKFLRANEPPLHSDIEFRNWLTNISGVGLKTASWVVRNWLHSNCVAILDIHIHRAGVILGIFDSNEDVSKCYLSMEAKFIEFADSINVNANVLDHYIWHEMRAAPITARKTLESKGVRSTDRCGLPAANNNTTARNYSLF